MQGTRDVRSALQLGMFGAVIDISDAYYHISVHKKARRYTRFIVDGVIYEYLGRHIIDLIIIDFIILGLPMGLTCSPRVFTRVSKFFCDWLRKKGVLIIIYIDVCY